MVGDGATGDRVGIESLPRRGDIQGLRALAVLLVVVYHSGAALPGGYVGVDVFFVISGYVITRMLVAELGATSRIDLRRFYLRRIRRLLPALGLMLTVVMMASVLLAPLGGQQMTARTGFAAALFNANTYLIRFGDGGYFDVSSELNALLHTWSLSVEEQFYLLFPALLFGAWILGSRRSGGDGIRGIGVVLGLITLVSFTLSWMLTNDRGGAFGITDLAREIAFYSPVTRAWQFAVGGLLVLAGSRFSRVRRVTATVLAIGGAALVGFAAVLFDQQTPFPGSAALVPTVGTMLFLVAGERADSNPLNRFLNFRAAQSLGDLSYSWYLWHWPFIVFAAALWPGAEYSGVAAGAASLIPAWLSYRFFETPLRFAPTPSSARTLTLAAACIVIPLGAGAALHASHRMLTQSESISAFEQGLEFHADVERGCDSAVPLGERIGPDCRWVVDDSRGEVVLIGDSFAGHLTEGLTSGANRNGLNAVVATRSACPFIDLIIVRNGERGDACRRFVVESLRDLLERTPDAVVISSSGYYVDSDEFVLESTSGERYAAPEEKAALWTDALSNTVDQLTAAGVDVVLVHAVPGYPGWDPRECAAGRVLFDAFSCGVSRSLVEADRDRARFVAAVAATAERTAAEELDLAMWLCPDGTCSTTDGKTWWWRDGGHISTGASERLAPVFSELLTSTG